MGYRYVVLGAGTQGVAVAYDLAKFGRSEYVALCDVDGQKATAGAARVNKLLGEHIVYGRQLDAGNPAHLDGVLRGADAVVSAMSFKLNEAVTDAAICAGVHMVDLGGNTGVVRAQHKHDARAIAACVSIVPDCGMGPGFNLSLAHSAISAIAQPESCSIYCGGLPQKPEGELKYALCFSMGGLVNEYSGFADVLADGKRRKRTCLGSVETLSVAPLVVLEASYTSGGLSTAPWTYQKAFPSLRDLKYKTLRYPGHWKMLREFRKQGRLREELETRLGTTINEFSDIGFIVAHADGRDAAGRLVHVERRVVDLYDDKTQFTAMQRLTGFHASIIAILAVQARIPRGVIPVELITGNMVIAEMEKRGIVTECI